MLVFIYCFDRNILNLFAWLANVVNFLQINGSSESVTKPTDVLSKSNGSEGANKEGKQ
jgi:hypothetical protein